MLFPRYPCNNLKVLHFISRESNQQNAMPVDNLANTKSKKSKTVLRKAIDTDFCYVCEWCDCKHESGSMNEFNHHVSLHRRAYTQHLGPEAERGEEEFIFYCQWRDCHSQIEGKVEEFTRHVHYHTFHQYLKFLGRHVQKVDRMGLCSLGSLTRNMIPELPEKLMCRWQDCNMVYDNPYIFYSHVAHHCEDIPKDKNSDEPFACRWEGCKSVLKSWYKIREHMRSHTQAKVVACPTCGSLFANNTRFIDHLMRQLQTGPSFECSNCGAKFASERLLRDHMRRHVNHYKCPLCDMTCPSPSSVRDHVRYRHSDERSYHCPDCDYRAKTAADLRVHLLSGVHSSKPHGRKTKASPDEHRDEDLNEEENKEDDESNTTQEVSKKIQPFEKEGEGQKSGPRNHKIRHRNFGAQQNEPLFQCHLCPMDYKRGSLLSRHLKEVHKYTLPSGHRRFRYKLHEDNSWRLQTVRLESKEVSEQLLGQQITSPQGSDDENNDCDDAQRLAIDEAGNRGKRAKAGPKKSGKAAPKKKVSNSLFELRYSSRKGHAGADISSHELLQSHEDINADDLTESLTGENVLEDSVEHMQDTVTEAARQNPGRRCKRKRSESEENHGEKCNERQKSQKKGRKLAQDTGLENSVAERLFPFKKLSVKAGISGKSLISLAAAAAGLDTLENKTEGEAELQGQRFSMPSMEDLSSVPAISNSAAESESQMSSHIQSSSVGVSTDDKKSKCSSLTQDKSGRPVRKGRALPSRFSVKRPCIIQEPLSPAGSSLLRVNSTKQASPKASKGRESESEKADMSPAAASTISSSSAWLPPSVDGVESVTDEGDAASASATPYYGTDTDFSEFNPDSPGSSTSVYAINPQYIQQLKQRLQQQPQEQQQLSSQVAEISGSQSPLVEESESPAMSITSDKLREIQDTPSAHMISKTLTLAEPAIVISSTVGSVSLPQQAPVAIHSHHREDTNDSWFALLTQAELCREEQQRQQFLGSPSKYAEVIVGSGSQLSSLADASACGVNHPAVNSCLSTSSTTSSSTTTLVTMSPQKTMVTPLTSPHKPSVTTLVSPPKTMFPSPEKSFFTIGWALGAGVSPVKQEWMFQVPPGDCSRPSAGAGCSKKGSGVVGEVELKCEEDAGVDFSRDSTEKIPFTNSNSKNTLTAISSLVTPEENLIGPKEDYQVETLHVVGNIANTPATALNGSAITNADENSVVVLSDTNMIYGDATDLNVPQELYQVVEGPNGEYQIVSLTSADLYNFVDSEGRSMVISQPLDDLDPGTDQPVANDTHSSVVVTVDRNTGRFVPAVVDSEDRHVCNSGMDTGPHNVVLEVEKTPPNTEPASIITKSEPASVNLQDCKALKSDQTLDQGSVQIKNETSADYFTQSIGSRQFVNLNITGLQANKDSSVNKTAPVVLEDTEAQENSEDNDKSLNSEDIHGEFSTAVNNLETKKNKDSCTVIKNKSEVSNSLHQNPVERKKDKVRDGDACDNINLNNSSCPEACGISADDKDSSGLYNLQMLGEVALSSEVPM